MPYLSTCPRRVWDRRAWVCGLDALDCPPDDPASFGDCPRFEPAKGVCPECLSLGRASQLAIDTDIPRSMPPHWACPHCGWHGGPAELLDCLAGVCSDLLDDVGFWRSRPESLAVDMGRLQRRAGHAR